MVGPTRSTRRILIGGSATAAIASVVQRGVPAASAQRGRHLLDLLAALEQAQIAQYQLLLATLDETSFAAAGVPDGARELVQVILETEQAHLAALIELGAANPIAASAVPAFDTARALQRAATVENLATAAYAGAIPDVRGRRVREAIIGLHSVEARQATILARLAGRDPLPEPFDRALPPQEALASIEAMLRNGESDGTPEALVSDLAPQIEAIARALGVSPDAVQIVSAEPRDWPDSSLGCPEPGMVYAEVITPGYLLVVDVEGERFEFHTDRRGNVVRCP